MNCVLIILSVYAVVCSLIIVILGSLLFSGEDVEEKSLMDCKDLQVDGDVTEVRNKIVKFDILNQDNGRIGLGETGEKCPVCTSGWLSRLEIVALTVLGVLALINLGRFSRYLKKLHAKRLLKKENKQQKQKAELRENILAELSVEQRGNEMIPSAASNGKDDMVQQVPAWEDATLSV